MSRTISHFAKKIFTDKTTNPIIQIFRSAVIGVISLVADMGALFVFTESGVHYLCSAVIGFVLGLVVNYRLNRTFVFTECKISLRYELLGYLVIALIGLVLTEALMYFFTEYLSLHYLVSKFLAAVIVLVWTFSARKKFLYA